MKKKQRYTRNQESKKSFLARQNKSYGSSPALLERLMGKKKKR